MKVIETSNYIMFRHWFRWYMIEADSFSTEESLKEAIPISIHELPKTLK